MYNSHSSLGRIAGIAAILLVSIVVLIGALLGVLAIGKSFSRYQKRADAKNQVTITHTRIQVAQQQAEINRAEIAATKAEAEKRYQESVGIRRAQDEIQKTLTPLYVQHEAIQAQERIATSGSNNTVIYVPAGTNGTPTITANSTTGK